MSAAQVLARLSLVSSPHRHTGAALPAAPVRTDAGSDLDITASLLALLRDRRSAETTHIAEALEDRGIDPVVRSFIEDDLREITDALSHLEVYVQECMEALRRPTDPVLMERAGDVSALGATDHLHQTLCNLRRRMIQLAHRVR